MDKIALTEEEQLRILNMKDLAENRKYYELLGVPTDSSPESIKAAYVQQSRDWHPDRFFRKELGKLSTDIENIFMRLTEAHNILSDPGTRKAYDRENNIDSVAISSRIQREKYQHRKGRKRKAFERRRGQDSSGDAKRSIRESRRERVLGSIRENIETQERRAAHFLSWLKRISNKTGRSKLQLLCILPVSSVQGTPPTLKSTRKSKELPVRLKPLIFLPKPKMLNLFKTIKRPLANTGKPLNLGLKMPVHTQDYLI